MEANEYDRIEQEALRIVETLNRLKLEIEGYKSAKEEALEKLDKLDDLALALTRVSLELEQTAEEIRQSNYVSLHRDFERQSKDLEASSKSFQMELERLPISLDVILRENERQLAKGATAFFEELDRREKEKSEDRRQQDERLTELCTGFTAFEKDKKKYDEKQSEELEQLKALVLQCMEHEESLQEQVSGLAETVDKIQKNTQKRFFRERG